MSIPIICPNCGKTISIERIPKITCSECGHRFGYSELQKSKLVVDTQAEAAELSKAKSAFMNGEFLKASQHFSRALEINANSYAAQYFVLLCDIYLHDGDKSYDVMERAVNILITSLNTLKRSNASADEKLKFVVAMLTETKIIINGRLTGRDEIFENNIDLYREQSIKDLSTLLDLFKVDRETMMSFSPDVCGVLIGIADCAIKVCYKIVQAVAIGEDIFAPNDAIYKKVSALCNEYCFFAHELDPSFNAKDYSPDFSQNYMFNDKVLSRFADFDEANKQNAKKYIVTDAEEYESILAESVKALRFTYLDCYRSMCSRQVSQHAQLFFNGFEILYRLLMPYVVADGKSLEIRTPKYGDMVDRCDILTRFLVDAYELDELVGKALHEFYEKLYDVVNMYYVPEMDKLAKIVNKLKGFKSEEYYIYQKLLFDCACCCAPALRKYVDFSAEPDKTRDKLVKICKTAVDDFMLFSDMPIAEIEQSNFFRPILQISMGIMNEDNA